MLSLSSETECFPFAQNPWRGRVERNAATKERNPVDLSKKGALPVVVVPDLSVQLGIDGSDKKANVDGSRQGTVLHWLWIYLGSSSFLP